MAPIYLIVGLINILAQTKNYGIKNDNPDMIIRVRRDIPDAVTTVNLNPFLKNENKRAKRQLSFYTPNISNGVTTSNNKKQSNNNRLDYNFATQHNGMLSTFTRNDTINYYSNWRANYSKYNNDYNRYNNTNNNNTPPSYNRGYNTQFTSMPRFDRRGINNITNPLYSHTGNLYNNTGNWIYGYNRNNTVNIPTSGLYVIPIYNKTGVTYHYTYPVYTQTQKYSINTESNIPIYNYQDPSKSNFNGYKSNNEFKYHNVTLRPYAPGYLPINNRTYRPQYNANATPLPFTPLPNNGVTSSNNVRTTTEKILSGCVICNIGCPAGKHRSGIFCVPDEYYVDY